MNTYESPSIIELGSIESVTNGSGTAHAYDSNYPGNSGVRGFLFNTGTSLGS